MFSVTLQSMPSSRACTYGSATTSLLGGNNIALSSTTDDDAIQLPIDFAWPVSKTSLKGTDKL